MIELRPGGHFQAEVAPGDTHITLLLGGSVPTGEPGDSQLEIPLSPVEAVPGEEPWEGQSPQNSIFTAESGLSSPAMLLLSFALFLAALFRRDLSEFCIWTAGKKGHGALTAEAKSFSSAK